MTTQPKSRVQAGVREGGQFATEARTEPAVSLEAPGECDICTDVTLPGRRLCPICEGSEADPGSQEAATAPTIPSPERLAGMDPTEVDAELATVLVDRARAGRDCESAMRALGRVVSLPALRYPARHSPDAIIKRAQLELAHPEPSRRVQRALDAVRAAQANADELDALAQAYDDEWERRGRWSRAFLVTGGNGHVHSSMQCSTCNRGGQATSFQFMTEFSGKDEGDIVASAGWRACTVCYPSAPVGDEHSLPTSMWSDEEKRASAARLEREAKKAARNADAIAKGLTADGSPLRVEWTARNSGGWDLDPQTHERSYVRRDRQEHQSFKTERSAVQWYVERKTWGLVDQSMTNDLTPAFEAIEQALAAKRGTDVETVRAELAEKVQQKRRRNGR